MAPAIFVASDAKCESHGLPQAQVIVATVGTADKAFAVEKLGQKPRDWTAGRQYRADLGRRDDRGKLHLLDQHTKHQHISTIGRNERGSGVSSSPGLHAREASFEAKREAASGFRLSASLKLQASGEARS